jgi:hypothetical protein
LRLKLLGLGLELGCLILELCLLLLQLDLLTLERAIGLMQRLVKPRILDRCRRPSPHILGVEEVVGCEMPRGASLHMVDGAEREGANDVAVGSQRNDHGRLEPDLADQMSVRPASGSTTRDRVQDVADELRTSGAKHAGSAVGRRWILGEASVQRGHGARARGIDMGYRQRA